MSSYGRKRFVVNVAWDGAEMGREDFEGSKGADSKSQGRRKHGLLWRRT